MDTRARVIPLRRPPAATAPDPAPEAGPRPAKPAPLEPPRIRLPQPEPLWREALGDRLRELRLDQGETLAEMAARAGLSPQYLSEVERGRKEPSSEMIAALAGALGITLTGLTEQGAPG